jgi:hypothetical protein
MSIQPYVDAIEWEPLAHPFEADVVRIGEVTGRLGTIRVERDAQYKLSVEIRSTDYAEWTKAHGEGVLGVIFEGVEIEAEDYPGRRIMLKNAVVLNTNHSWGRGGQASTRVDVMVSGVSRALQPAAKASLLVDWFLSGPGYGEMTYWRTTDRERTETFTRTRRGYSEDESEHDFASEKPPAGFGIGTARDYLALDLPAGPVRVCKVPNGHAPDWANPIAIEYPCQAGEPNEDLRDGVVEALGFLFGRHILRIGTTAYDPRGYATRWETISPWGSDVSDAASRSDTPAVPLGASRLETPPEQVLSPLVAKFLAQRDELNLSHVVWTMWIASRMPITFDVPLYASALEALMNAWFASKRSRTGGVYMEKTAFQERFAGALSGFATAAEGLAYGDRIVRRANGANAMGVNERFEVFFEELGLPIEKGERAVIRARNVSAHGRHSSQPQQDQLWLGAGYRTLLNRAILKALDCGGRYIDYSAPGHEDRLIDEPIGYRPQK